MCDRRNANNSQNPKVSRRICRGASAAAHDRVNAVGPDQSSGLHNFPRRKSERYPATSATLSRRVIDEIGELVAPFNGAWRQPVKQHLAQHLSGHA
jgi:hypothetical protein